MFLLCSEYFGPILVPPEMQIQCWSGQTPHSINWVASQRLRLQPCVLSVQQQNVHNTMDLVTNCSHSSFRAHEFNPWVTISPIMSAVLIPNICQFWHITAFIIPAKVNNA